jgi:hypothetical protein
MTRNVTKAAIIAPSSAHPNAKRPLNVSDFPVLYEILIPFAISEQIVVFVPESIVIKKLTSHVSHEAPLYPGKHWHSPTDPLHAP